MFDVAVNLRSESHTYGKWYGIEMNEKNKKQFLIPKGFAHGFLGRYYTAGFCYKYDDFYYSNDEGGLAWNDTEISIVLPRVCGEYTGIASAEGYSVGGIALNLSDKDQKWMGISNIFKF